MTPPAWLTQLVRARQAQEDGATARLAFANRARNRAQDEARAQRARLEAMARRQADADAGAFVAASVALQAAAATHAAALGEVDSAVALVHRRDQELTAAATERYAAERMLERAADEAADAEATAEQAALDEAAATGHRAAREQDRP